MKRVCVFCGSSVGDHARYAAGAEGLGRALTARGFDLVYGGASVGLMGAVADAVLAGGGEVVGVIPEALAAKEIAHTGLTELVVVTSMHERKATMADRADAFIALPGGLGTLEELFEVLTWAQLGIHSKPVGLLDIDGYFAPLLQFLDNAVAHRFVRPQHLELMLVRDSPESLLDAFDDHEAVPTGKWLDRSER